jgi:hypothetical protein
MADELNLDKYIVIEAYGYTWRMKKISVFTEDCPEMQGNFENDIITIPTKTMNRQVKFRGKTIGERTAGDWVYGNLIVKIDGLLARAYIMPFEIENHGMVEVDPNTVGQYVPIKNGSGDGLYEGDIISFDANYCVRERNLNNIIGELVFETGRYVLKTKYGSYDIQEETDEFYYKSKIVGNITDNPELLNDYL